MTAINYTPNGDILLQHCRQSLSRRYSCTTLIYNLSRQCSLSVDRANKRKWLYTKKQEADDILPKL